MFVLMFLVPIGVPSTYTLSSVLVSSTICVNLHSREFIRIPGDTSVLCSYFQWQEAMARTYVSSN